MSLDIHVCSLLLDLVLGKAVASWGGILAYLTNAGSIERAVRWSAGFDIRPMRLHSLQLLWPAMMGDSHDVVVLIAGGVRYDHPSCLGVDYGSGHCLGTSLSAVPPANEEHPTLCFSQNEQAFGTIRCHVLKIVYTEAHTRSPEGRLRRCLKSADS